MPVEPPILRLFEIAESQHEIQNPTSAEKILLLGERLRLTSETEVLDVASGRGGPALLLAAEFGCRVAGIELSGAFLEIARARARECRLDSRVRFEHGDAAQAALEPGSYDVALCLGASFVFGGLAETLATLAPVARTHVAVGEPYWRTVPLPPDYPGADQPFTTLAETVERFDAAGLRPISAIVSSEDDWDRYETLHWRTLEEWLAANHDDPQADAVRAFHLQHRERYLRWERELLGWAIIPAWKHA